jgi:hypothetical protein
MDWNLFEYSCLAGFCFAYYMYLVSTNMQLAFFVLLCAFGFVLLSDADVAQSIQIPTVLPLIIFIISTAVCVFVIDFVSDL